jgi:hypothetical protein
MMVLPGRIAVTWADRSHSIPIAGLGRRGKRHRLSHAHVQMARQFGLSPAKLGKLDNHQHEHWKAPLPQFIEHLYFKRFGRDRPDAVQTIEDVARTAERRVDRATRRSSRQSTVEEPTE